ncbi:MAG: twin-arginine translocase TatA/TatE family subunit [Desulfovibrio sp.]|jgi:sec-independent protein translocase protein TatA|nr:twin-arginine translocase TatA/TatE family subunit [Desulfovibrio sp.]
MLGPIGPSEIILILVVVLLIFGSKKLPEIGAGLGRAIRNFRRATTEPAEVDITPKAEKEANTTSKEHKA